MNLSFKNGYKGVAVASLIPHSDIFSKQATLSGSHSAFDPLFHILTVKKYVFCLTLTCKSLDTLLHLFPELLEHVAGR